MDATRLAAEMMAQCVGEGQASRTVASDADAAALRSVLRESARASGVRIRTARVGGAVVVVRTDAALWGEDTATMRSKLTPTP